MGAKGKKEENHGLWNSPEYRVWHYMRQRCENKQDTSYSRYGARGIKVCANWKSFSAFYADMGPRPTPQHSIERKNNNGDYCPENCIWVHRDEQAKNTRKTKIWNINGKRFYGLLDAERGIGLRGHTIQARCRSASWPEWICEGYVYPGEAVWSGRR